MSEELYTLEQLSERVADLLNEGYDGQRSGRVRELPNGRTIRWYTTIGLVDRPLATQGRVALYGPRHALQLAAVKQLQAQGKTLAEVQQELIGATDRRLAEIARVPPRIRMDIVHPREEVVREVAALITDRPATDTVTNVVPAFRISDTVTVLLDGASRPLDDADIAALTAAAEPLLDAIEQLGLSPRKERR